jgi:hypothetical protein
MATFLLDSVLDLLTQVGQTTSSLVALLVPVTLRGALTTSLDFVLAVTIPLALKTSLLAPEPVNAIPLVVTTYSLDKMLVLLTSADAIIHL